MEPDVLKALKTLGSEPVAVERIGRTWREGRVTYRVTLRDGRVVKARRAIDGGAKAAKSGALLAALNDRAVPAPISTVGPVTLERWVDGLPVAGRRLAAASVEAAADLLARLHSTTAVDGRRVRRSAAASPEVARAESRLADLAATGVVERGEARRLVALVKRSLPQRSMRGLIHGDLCAHNLVTRSDGELVSVDNETLRIDFLDYDLARTWSRWPMPAWAWSKFTHRYEAFGRLMPPADVEFAWRVVAAVKSAYLWSQAPDGIGDEERLVLRKVIESMP